MASRRQHVLLVSSEKPRVRDARRGLGRPVRRPGALRRHADYGAQADARRASPPTGACPVYALGPPSAISDKALGQVHKVAPGVKRVGAEDPVANAIDFARYVDGTFGWNVNDPGHGFVIANVSRPQDAAASAALSASGDWGPLLVTDDASEVPAPLRNYLLDVKPGYVSDPTRAVYNHMWLIGDQDAVSVDFQAEIDDLAEVAQVSPAPAGAPAAPPGQARNRADEPIQAMTARPSQKP